MKKEYIPFYKKTMHHIETMVDKKISESKEKETNEIVAIIEKKLSDYNKSEVKRLDQLIYKRFDTNKKETEKALFSINNSLEERMISLNNNIDKRMSMEIDKLIELNKETENKICNISDNIFFEDNKVAYYYGEKIRVIFLFQIDSFWPSWESLYYKILKDTSFDCKFLFLKGEKDFSQMKNSEEFLIKNKIKYENASIENIKKFNPHILIMQTPYDIWHREKDYYSSEFIKLGIRTIYIPYGIEIGAEPYSLGLQYKIDFIKNCWKIYTVSERVVNEYKKHSNLYRNSVVATGHPKFDGIYYRHTTTNKLSLNKNNKTALLKFHFKLEMIGEDKTKYQVTPDINEYIDFLNKIKKYNNINFILMLHPKFYDTLSDKEIESFSLAVNKQNIIFFDESDYREALYKADFVICDRSSISIEVGALNIPILYMENEKREENKEHAFKELLLSYERGKNSKDMIKFLERSLKGIDTNKEKRQKAFNKCIPYYDGKASDRIIEDIKKSIFLELSKNKE